MPVALRSLVTNCRESKSPPKQGSGLSPIPVIDPKDWACSPSPIKVLAMVPSSKIPLPQTEKYACLLPSSLDATPKDEPN